MKFNDVSYNDVTAPMTSSQSEAAIGGKLGSKKVQNDVTNNDVIMTSSFEKTKFSRA